MLTATLRTRLHGTFPALYHRNFRLFWTGQCISLVGTWMQNIGQSWLVYKLTGSPLKLGIVSAVQWLPVLLFSFAAGPLVDRFPKRRILLATQTVLMLLALVLSGLVATGLVRYWHVLCLGWLLGCVNTIDNPTRQAFVIEMVGRDDLMNAISLNSTVFNLARILGPGAAGLLIAAVGIAPCFLINGISFLAVLWALSRIRVREARAPRPDLRLREYGASIKEGMRYVARTPEILWPIVLIGVLSTFVLNYSVVIPVFSTRVLGGDAREYGFLMTALGLGSTAGSVALAARSRRGPRIQALLLGALGTSVFSLLVGVQHGFLLSCLLLAVTGYTQITCTAQINATLQMRSTDAMRGRVMSVYNLAFGGVTPFGSMYAGWLVDRAGSAAALVVSGVLGVLGTAFCALGVGRQRRTEGREAEEH